MKYPLRHIRYGTLARTPCGGWEVFIAGEWWTVVRTDERGMWEPESGRCWQVLPHTDKGAYSHARRTFLLGAGLYGTGFATRARAVDALVMALLTDHEWATEYRDQGTTSEEKK